MSTKICPYCGEDILATAKKCRHCGEWLDSVIPSSEPIPPIENSTVAAVPTDDDESGSFGWAQYACWMAMLFEFVSMFQSFPEEHAARGKGFLSWLACSIANIVPDWAVTIVLGVLWVVLILSLRTFCQKYDAANKIPFIALACLMVGGYLVGLGGSFIEDEDVDAFLFVFGIFGLLVVIAWSIVEFIVGIKLMDSAITGKLGIAFMVGSVFPIITLVLVLGFGFEDGDSGSIICGIVESLISIYILYLMKEVVFTSDE